MNQVTVRLSAPDKDRGRISKDFTRALRLLHAQPQNNVSVTRQGAGCVQLEQRADTLTMSNIGERAADIQRGLSDYSVTLRGMPESPVVELIHQGN